MFGGFAFAGSAFAGVTAVTRAVAAARGGAGMNDREALALWKRLRERDQRPPLTRDDEDLAALMALDLLS